MGSNFLLTKHHGIHTHHPPKKITSLTENSLSRLSSTLGKAKEPGLVWPFLATWWYWTASCVHYERLTETSELGWQLPGEASQYRTPESEDLNTSLQKVQVGSSLTKASISVGQQKWLWHSLEPLFQMIRYQSECLDPICLYWTVWKRVWATPYSINSWNTANAADSQNYLLWRDVSYRDISQDSDQLKIPNQQVKKQKTGLHLGLGRVATTVTVDVFV